MSKAKLAYAIWPWGLKTQEQMITALQDIKAIGFNYFESVSNAVDMFRDKLPEFRAITAKYQVYPVSFYFWHTGDIVKDVQTFEKALDFLAANNIKTVSIQAKGKKGGATEQELKECVATLEKLGQAAKPYGITPCLHPHANTVIMYEKEVDFAMRNTNPDEIGFGPDTAHLTVGLCDAVEIFDRYAKRIKFVHLKDVKKNKKAQADDGKQGFEVFSSFLELGEGEVDLPGIFKILDKAGFDGYLTAELDSSRFGNKESAAMNMKYLKTHGFNQEADAATVSCSRGGDAVAAEGIHAVTGAATRIKIH